MQRKTLGVLLVVLPPILLAGSGALWAEPPEAGEQTGAVPARPLLEAAQAGEPAGAEAAAGVRLGPETAAQAPDATPSAAYYRAWLSLVEPLISPAERAAFEGLASDREREAFMEGFWRVRDPTPGTPENEARERWYRSARLVAEIYADPRDERGTVTTLVGSLPLRTHRFPGCSPLWPLEVWQFRPTWDAVGGSAGASSSSSSSGDGGFYAVFVEKHSTDGGKFYRLWSPEKGRKALVFDPSGNLSWEAALEQARTRCQAGDWVWEELERALAEAVDLPAVRERVGLRPPPADWLAEALRRPASASLEAEVRLSFPGYDPEAGPAEAGARPAADGGDLPAPLPKDTVVAGRIVPSRGDLEALSGSDPSGVVILELTGEVFRRGALVDRFRYRFHQPPLRHGRAVIPLTFARSLPPGEYLLSLRLAAGSGAASRRWRQVRELQVPRRDVAAPVGVAAGKDGFTDVLPALAGLQVVPPGEGLQVGRVAVTALVFGTDVAAVRYRLNGKAAGESTEPPYRVELDLGPEPREHQVEAAAYDRDGRLLARDAIRLNAGPYRFAVRLVEPSGTGAPPGETVRARVAVEVPDGARLERVELFLNEEPAVVLFQPPFVQTLTLPPDQEVTFVRAVATLADGRTAEDVVLLQAPDEIDEVNVELVELYTAVEDAAGRAVTGLTAADFTVFDEGEEQEIHRFALVEDLSIHVAVLMDTSESMAERLEEARQSALRFFRQVLTPRDKAAFLTFDSRLHLHTAFTADVEALAAATRGLTAAGGTSLWDSLILSLHYFGGLEGKRALILLSDGEDVHSSFDFDSVLEYARRTGVAIYPVALPGEPLRRDGLLTAGDRQFQATRYVHSLKRLAEETGGRYTAIQEISELDALYAALSRELRSQYLLTYHVPEGAGPGFRTVEVRVNGRGREARTLRGYYAR